MNSRVDGVMLLMPATTAAPDASAQMGTTNTSARHMRTSRATSQRTASAPPIPAITSTAACESHTISIPLAPISSRRRFERSRSTASSASSVSAIATVASMPYCFASAA